MLQIQYWFHSAQEVAHQQSESELSILQMLQGVSLQIINSFFRSFSLFYVLSKVNLSFRQFNVIKKRKITIESLCHMYDTIRIIPSNTCFPDSSALQFLICRFLHIHIITFSYQHNNIKFTHR